MSMDLFRGLQATQFDIEQGWDSVHWESGSYPHRFINASRAWRPPPADPLISAWPRHMMKVNEAVWIWNLALGAR
jgi:hypothetical protein